jgi:hypothetical protein
METPMGMVSFYFNRLSTEEDTRYHISFIDRDRKAQMINMTEHKGRWKIMNPETCPEWILNLEKEFESSIKENLRED